MAFMTQKRASAFGASRRNGSYSWKESPWVILPILHRLCLRPSRLYASFPRQGFKCFLVLATTYKVYDPISHFQLLAQSAFVRLRMQCPEAGHIRLVLSPRHGDNNDERGIGQGAYTRVSSLLLPGLQAGVPQSQIR